jgi:site-specific DNA-cytosine methylase
LKYTSESNARLRKFLQSKYKRHRGNGRDKSRLGYTSGTKTVIAEDCATGSHEGGDNYLGTDGQLDLYMTGSQCQPFSKMGKNGGRADERSDTMRDTVSFIMKRKPTTFIMEQVPNIKSKPHNKFWAKILDKLRSIKTKKDQEFVQAAHEDTQQPGLWCAANPQKIICCRRSPRHWKSIQQIPHAKDWKAWTYSKAEDFAA